jgi:hypothetical protein
MISFGLVTRNTLVVPLRSQVPLEIGIRWFRCDASTFCSGLCTIDGADRTKAAAFVTVWVIKVIQIPWIRMAVGGGCRRNVFRTTLARLQADVLRTKRKAGGCCCRRAHHGVVLLAVVGRNIAHVAEMLSDEAAEPAVVWTKRGRVNINIIKDWYYVWSRRKSLLLVAAARTRSILSQPVFWRSSGCTTRSHCWMFEYGRRRSGGSGQTACRL